MSLWLRIKANCDSFGQKDEDRLKISIHQSFIRLNSCILIEAIIALLSYLFEIGAMYIILNLLTLNILLIYCQAKSSILTQKYQIPHSVQITVTLISNNFTEEATVLSKSVIKLQGKQMSNQGFYDCRRCGFSVASVLRDKAACISLYCRCLCVIF